MIRSVERNLWSFGAAAQIRSLYPKISIVLVTAYIGYALEGYLYMSNGLKPQKK